MRKTRMADTGDISNWVVGAIAALPIVGVYFTIKADQRKDRDERDRKRAVIYEKIDDCNARTAAAETKTAELELKLSECRLDVEGRFASNGYLQAVEQRLTKQIDKLEMLYNKVDERRGD